MGTTSTTATANWTVVADAVGFPTSVSGDDVKIYSNLATPPFGGEAWSDVDLMDAIPSGATITDVTFSVTVQVDGSRASASIPVNPAVEFIDKGQYLAETWLAIYGRFAAGGVGALPDDNDPHALDYVNSVYAPLSGAGVSDLAGFAAALSNPSTPVIVRALAPLQPTDGSGITYFAPLTITFTWDDALPCDTWVDLDLSTATFDNPSGDQFGQYVDGIITGLDGHYAQYWFPFELDPAKRYRVRITFDPSSPDDAGGRWVLLYAALPGDEDGAYAHAQIGDGFSNTADEVTLTIGPTLGNWDDPDTGVPQGYTRLSFRSSEAGAVSAISIRKVCKTVIPWQRLTNRDELRLTGRRSTQGSSRLTGYL